MCVKGRSKREIISSKIGKNFFTVTSPIGKKSVKIQVQVQVLKFQTRTVQSRDPETNVIMLGLKDTQVTRLTWPLNSPINFHLSISHTATECLSPLASNLPSKLMSRPLLPGLLALMLRTISGANESFWTVVKGLSDRNERNAFNSNQCSPCLKNILT